MGGGKGRHYSGYTVYRSLFNVLQIELNHSDEIHDKYGITCTSCRQGHSPHKAKGHQLHGLSAHNYHSWILDLNTIQLYTYLVPWHPSLSMCCMHGRPHLLQLDKCCSFQDVLHNWSITIMKIINNLYRWYKSELAHIMHRELLPSYTNKKQQ